MFLMGSLSSVKSIISNTKENHIKSRKLFLLFFFPSPSPLPPPSSMVSFRFVYCHFGQTKVHWTCSLHLYLANLRWDDHLTNLLKKKTKLEFQQHKIACSISSISNRTWFRISSNTNQNR